MLRSKLEIPKSEQLGVPDDRLGSFSSTDLTSSYEERNLLAGTVLVIFIAIAPKDLATVVWHHGGSEVEINL